MKKIMKRREFLQTAALCSGALAVAGAASGATAASASANTLTAADLPRGGSPKPVEFPHFPSRLHAFVWRNWPLVPVARMAAAVGTSPDKIRALGKAMGLGMPPRITRDLQRRSYLTVIRRNWHLLPYEQLLTLLDWTPQEMAYTLREDDFFYIKLGSLKPKCEPLRWKDSDAATREVERKLASLAQKELGGETAKRGAQLFGFLRDITSFPAEPANLLPQTGGLRYCYSYCALYGDPLLDREADPFPEGYLARLAAAGVNGVWLQAVLYRMAHFPWQPELSNRSHDRVDGLYKLVARAKRYGIELFLYLNEPRAMPLRFFESRTQLKGATEGDHAVLCTSVPEVRQYLTDSIAGICKAVPNLGGFFTITASENLTHCWSHGGGAQCPRCGKRPPADVVAEVNRAIAEGIEKGRGTTAAEAEGPRLLAWDWGWNDAWAEAAIRQLPSGVSVMSVSEWSLPIERGGIKSEVGEYSISAVGPGPRAQRHWRWAKEKGLRTVAKVQAANTWELSSVPYIPAVEKTAQHGVNLREAGVRDLMLGWTLGGWPSPNLEVMGEAMRGGTAEQAMSRVAQRRFGDALAPAVVAAWRVFSAAFGEFPYHIGVLYEGPQQMGPANLLWAEPTGFAATMTGFPYDSLNQWRAIYPPEVFAAQMEKVAAGFERGVASLKALEPSQLQAAGRQQKRALEDEMVVAEAAGIHFRSSANQARFVHARNALASLKQAEQAAPLLDTLDHSLKDEIRLARRLFELQNRDSRLGFEAANHYFYVPADLVEKILNCNDLLERWLPVQRQRWLALSPR